MFMKKLLVSALCALCAVSLLVPVAFAHGCHGSSRTRRTVQPCSVEDCTVTGYHYHSRTMYCGHTHGNSLCDGSCAPLCTVEDCTLAGRHYHDGIVYCGTDHDVGYCNEDCSYTQSPNTWSGHHGGHHSGHHGSR